MADISKIKPNGASGDEYEIKDTTARTGVLNLNAVTQSSKNVASTEVISVSDAAPINAEDVTVAIEPVQDLHGYDKPWTGGTGKNLIPMTVSGIKSANTSGSWTNKTYTHVSGMTVEILIDNDDNITGFKFNGTSTSAAVNFLFGSSVNIANGTYILNTPNASGVAGMWLSTNTPTTAIDLTSTTSGNVTVTNGSINTIHVYINRNVTLSNYVISPMLRLNTISDATFAPYTNICPISGWDSVNVVRAGKNWFTTDANDYEVGTIDPSTGALLNDSNYKRTKEYLPIRAGSYKLINAYNFRMFLYDSSKNYLGYVDGASVMTISKLNTRFYKARWTASNDMSTAMLYLSSFTDNTFEPYQGNTYTVSLSSAGTVYSGTLDVTTGSLVVDKGMVDLGTIDWTTLTGEGVIAGTFYSELPDYKYISAIATPNFVCSQYKSIPFNDRYENGSVFISNLNRVFISDANYSSATTGQFKTAMNGVQLVYELATPQTYTLTLTQIKMLLNNNTLYADCGDITLKYQPNNVIGELKGEIEDVAGKVTQPITNTDESRPLLFAESDSNTTDTARKSGNIKVNPYKDIDDDRYATLTLGNNLAEGASGKAGGRLELHNPWSTGKVTLEGYAEDGEELNFSLPSEDPTASGVTSYFTTLATLAHIGLVKQYRVPEAMHTISVTSGAIGSYITTIEINCYWAQHPVIHAAITSLKSPEKYIAVVTCPYQYNKLYVHLYRATTDAFVIDEEDIRIISIHYYDPLAP